MTPGSRLLLAAGLLAALGCETVNLGDPPADVNACRPSQAFFRDEIWPNVLGKSYGGRTCADARCHDASGGRMLLIVPPTSAPTTPFPAGSDWDAVYQSAADQMNCTNATGSELYTRPTGLRTHGGGKLFEPDGPEGVLLQMWGAMR